jgi:hypothetical protein
MGDEFTAALARGAHPVEAAIRREEAAAAAAAGPPATVRRRVADPHKGNLTAFAVDGVSGQPDDSTTWMFMLFLRLASSGHGKAIFSARRVCKRWQSFIQDMTSNDWFQIYAAANSAIDPLLSKFVLSPPPVGLGLTLKFGTNVPKPDVPATTNPADIMSAIRQVLTTPCRDASIDPSVWTLLDHLAATAVTAACAGTRFAMAFDLPTRGYAYYATFKSRNKNKPDAYKKLSQWWRQALPRVQAQVQERLDAAGATEEKKLAARASVADFVVKMRKVTLHNRDVIAEGEELMQGGVGAARHAAWAWPAAA